MGYPRGWSEVSWFEVCCYLAIIYHRHLLWLSSQNVGLLMLCRDTSVAVVLSVNLDLYPVLFSQFYSTTVLLLQTLLVYTCKLQK